MNHIRRRLWHLLWASDMEMTRLTLALSGLVWALLLLVPGHLFTPARTTYSIMSQMFNEVQWGLLFLLQGSVMLWSILTGQRERWVLWADGILGCLLWSSTTIACFAAHWPKTPDFWSALTEYAPPAAMSGEVGLMFASWWLLVRFHQEGAA